MLKTYVYMTFLLFQTKTYSFLGLLQENPLVVKDMSSPPLHNLMAHSLFLLFGNRMDPADNLPYQKQTDKAVSALSN